MSEESESKIGATPLVFPMCHENDQLDMKSEDKWNMNGDVVDTV